MQSQNQVHPILIDSQTTISALTSTLEKLDRQKKVIFMADPCKGVVEAIPDNSQVIIDSPTTKEAVEWLKGKGCFIYLKNPLESVVKAIPNGSKVIINSFTTKKAVEWLKGNNCIINLREPVESVVKAIPNDSHVAIDNFVTKELIECLVDKDCFFILNAPFKPVVQAIPNRSQVVINSDTTKEVVEWLKGKNCIIHLIEDLSESVIKAIPNRSQVVINLDTTKEVVEWLNGKECFIFLNNPLEPVVKAIPNDSRIVINSLTTKEAVEWLDGKNNPIYLINPLEPVVKAIPNGSRVIINSLTAEKAVECLNGKNCLIELNDPLEPVVKAIPTGSRVVINTVTTEKAVEWLNGKNCIIELHNPLEEVVKAITNGSQVIINSLTTKEAVEWLKGKGCSIYLKNPLELVVKAIPNASRVFIDSSTTEKAVECLSGKDCPIYLHNPGEHVVKAISDRFQVTIYSQTSEKSVRWLIGKLCVVNFINPSETVVKALPNGTHVGINSHTTKESVKWLNGKGCAFYLMNPSETVVKAIPNGSRVVINSFTTKEAIEWLNGKGCVIELRNFPESLVSAIPMGSKVLVPLHTSQKSIQKLVKRKCLIEYANQYIKVNEFIPAASEAKVKIHTSTLKKNHHAKKPQREVSNFELKKYFEEIEKKLKNKKSIIGKITYEYQMITLTLLSEMQDREEEVKFIQELQQIPGVSFISSIIRTIKIDESISKDGFEALKKILNQYESEKVEMATSDEKNSYLKALQNRIQAKNYLLNLECIDGVWKVKLGSDLWISGDWGKVKEELSHIDGIKFNEGQIEISNEISLVDFKKAEEILNAYELSLKKVARESSQLHDGKKDEVVRRDEYFNYSYRSEQPSTSEKSSTSNKPSKKKKVKNKSQAKKTKSVSSQIKSPVVNHHSSPTYLIPESSPLSLSEREFVEEQLKRRDKNSDGISTSINSISETAFLKPASNSNSSSSSHLTSQSLFSSSSQGEVKKVHCCYNDSTNVESFMYPPLFSKSLIQLKYVIKNNQFLQEKEMDKISDAGLYGLIQLLEITQRLFEYQRIEQVNMTFQKRILDMGFVIQLRQELKPENISRHKENAEKFMKFQKALVSFRQEFISNMNWILFSYENEFEKNEMMTLNSMKKYHDQFKFIFDQKSTSLENISQFSKNEVSRKEKIIRNLLDQYHDFKDRLKTAKDESEEMIYTNQLKYVIIGMADISEELYPSDKNHLLGLISIRNQLMHVMEYEGGQVMRDLSKDAEDLEDANFVLSIDFLNQKIVSKQTVSIPIASPKC